MLFLARLLDGASGGNISIAQAYISDVTPEEKRSRAFGSDRRRFWPWLYPWPCARRIPGSQRQLRRTGLCRSGDLIR